MKKYLLLLSAIIPTSAFAANMCVKNDTLFVVLDPNIAATSTSYDNNERTWSATFSFGTISGIAGCALASSVGGASALASPSTSQTAISMTGTAINGAMIACKMLLPVETKWINSWYYSTTPNSVACSTISAQSCAALMSQTANTIRAGIFGNVIE